MKKFLFAVMLFTAVQAKAQISGKDPVPYISVTGTAEKEVVPDIIYIAITLVDKIEGKSTYTIDEQEVKLKQIVKNLNIDLSNLTLTDASSAVILKRQKEKGVTQRKGYMLKVSTVDEVNKVFEALFNNNIKEAVISGTDHSQITTLRKEVRIDAIKAAKEKAIYLLEAIGEQPGKPLVIEEETYNRYNNSNFLAQAVGGESANEVSMNGIAFENITIKFSYNIKYSIK